ncbi:SIS domain-containing protein [Nonomuraea sp. FMUSA5-5]|uniref:SIS domain-containing protein n=1 Tax=Nonomuraea composti TaxID=2720023 RepID=A0ABX1BRS4_9ACTN|nr:SIS domain-containing protein [Nonomuraea sp. FMUSA5-5]NJP97453.1 SIS domain-containing protein [Nonomuraea sp. FMUSA5-5]
MTLSWISAAMKVLEEVQRTQEDALARAAELAARSIARDGVVYAFGTGHSRMPVEEIFPRYGSFPGFHPIVELSMTFHNQVVGANGQRQAMFIERVAGLADQILANFRLRPQDSLMVFSVSGLNAVPIEMAMGARQAGLPVIAVTSLAETHASPARHPSGTRLADHADVVIDLCSPVGDALCHVDGVAEPIGPVSTLTAVAVVNEIKVRSARLLAAGGGVPPIITSSRLVGDARSSELFEAAYHDFARRAAATLRGAGEEVGDAGSRGR